MYTWILVFLLCSWKIETLFLNENIKSYRLCSFKTVNCISFFISVIIAKILINQGKRYYTTNFFLFYFVVVYQCYIYIWYNLSSFHYLSGFNTITIFKESKTTIDDD